MLRSAPLFAAWCAADPGPIAQGGRVPALRSSARALHRVRDTGLIALRIGTHGSRVGKPQRAHRLSVPRMLRSAPLFAAWCAADPGPIMHSAPPWVPDAVHREERCTASGTRDSLLYELEHTGLGSANHSVPTGCPFPGCCAARRSSRRGALLIRGPLCSPHRLG